MAAEKGYEFWKTTLKEGKYILAPMVEQSELPWRMLSRKYGSHVCYTPMMHAGVFLRDKNYRVENFVSCPEDRPLIAQFCSDDPETFLGAAKLIEDECDAIDLNLGCPQHIAKRGHYGSFLQDEWELIHSILSTAVKGLKIPVTAKIRVFDDIDKSVRYARMIESTGISLLTVHGRTREQKGPFTGLASWKHIKAIKDALKIPVFANGNILCFNDVERCLSETGCEGMMVAEPNLYNPALFSGQNPSVWDIGNEYLDFVEKHPCSFAAIRAHVFKIFHKVFERYPDIREKTGLIKGDLKNISELRQVFDEVKQLCLEDEDADKLDSSGLKFYQCQAYIRHEKKTADDKAKLDEKLLEITSKDSSSMALKRHVDEITSSINGLDQAEQESAMKLVKYLERKRRKQDRIERKAMYIEQNLKKIEEYNENPEEYVKKRERAKYAFCVCKNIRGEKCEHSMCRKCCKEKIERTGEIEELECRGHKLKSKKLRECEKQLNDKEQSNEAAIITTTVVH